MCGIAGYVGGKNAPEILFDMLKRLEYRGYDSAGIACITGEEIIIPKDKGKVDEVRSKIKPEELDSKIGAGHTRWATHGRPSQLNAHPHLSQDRKIAVVHNGIIENFQELKEELTKHGFTFQSETDTEVIAHLIELYYEGDLLTAFKKALHRLHGSFALTVISLHEPDKILVARNESPLLLGVGKQENYVASDAPAFLPYTKKLVILDDMDYGVITKKSIELWNLSTGKRIKPRVEEIKWDVAEAEKGGFHHFMLKEIMEEADAAKKAFSGLRDCVDEITAALTARKRIYLVACGTAYYASMVGKYTLEHFGIQAESVVASEFRYSTLNTIDDNCAVIAISQSGETADTLAAVKGAKSRGAYVVGIINVVGSSLTRIADKTIYIHSGPEIGVASSKAYIGQLVCLIGLALSVAQQKKAISEVDAKAHLKELSEIHEKISLILGDDSIKDIAEKYANTKTFFYIGRKQNYPTALEGSHKLKEISYVHAEAYPAGELKHGANALLESEVVVIAVLSTDELGKKMQSNIQEMAARGASVLTVGPKGVFKVPEVNPLFAPILDIVPLHLFAYYISVLKGLDPDKPRNLAKSVTVE
ncbi:MAG: glutamine--fructose-6-phosphate transaminase (isomerizing) [Methanobacteriota archaeon]